MHSNIGLKDGLLFRENTNLCLGGGWSRSIKALNNCLILDDKVKTITTNCFGKTFIGPGKAIIFEGFINLKNEAITAPQFKHIVFKKDAFINEKAFYSKQGHIDYILYCFKGSNVEQFALTHGFKFKTLKEFKYKGKNTNYRYTMTIEEIMRRQNVQKA